MNFFTYLLALLAVVAQLTAASPLFQNRASAMVPGKWIITLKPDVDLPTVKMHHIKVREVRAHNISRRTARGEREGGVEHEYSFGSFKGYSGSFDAGTIEELKKMPEVLRIEEDTVMAINALTTQNGAPWGLGSISTRSGGADSYVYDDSAGQGTYSYVVDSGIRVSHNQFGGRAVWGYNAVLNTSDSDNLGHGTHVAGIIGGDTYGVAKKTTLIAVKVFENRHSTASTIMAGIDWAINDILYRNRQNTAVINMSISGPVSSAWDTIMTSAWNAGILVVVSAGNDDQLASNFSPARSPEPITVGGIQSNYSRYGGIDGSNYGPAVDIFASGARIVSAYNRSDNDTAIFSGTSGASPYVAGLVSYVRGLEGASSAASAKARILELGTHGLVTDARNSANLVAYNGNGR